MQLLRFAASNATIKIWDLVSSPLRWKFVNAVKAALERTDVQAKTIISRANSRGQKIATLTLAVIDWKIAHQRHLKIGWVGWWIRAKIVVSRCYKCLGLSHVAGNWSCWDHNKFCFKCGSEEPKASSCSSLANRASSDQPGHISGFSRSMAYKLVLEKLKATRCRWLRCSSLTCYEVGQQPCSVSIRCWEKTHT